METKKTHAEAVQAIIDYFEENPDIFNECIEELDAWNGYLGDDRCYPMDELDDLYSDTDASEVLRRAFFGYDADTWTTDAHGDKEYGAFNPMRDYFYFNGYGNLVSTDDIDYSGFIDEYAVESMYERYGEMSTIADNDDLDDLFSAISEADDEQYYNEH